MRIWYETGKHKKIAQDVAHRLKKLAATQPTYEKARAQLLKKAKFIETETSKRLRKPTRMKIHFSSAEKDKKDNDIDFKIVIAPNATELSDSGKPQGSDIVKRKTGFWAWLASIFRKYNPGQFKSTIEANNDLFVTAFTEKYQSTIRKILEINKEHELTDKRHLKSSLLEMKQKYFIEVLRFYSHALTQKDEKFASILMLKEVMYVIAPISFTTYRLRLESPLQSPGNITEKISRTPIQ